MQLRAVAVPARVGFAALATFAIAVQLRDLAERGVLNPVNFFSYFTIQSNVIAIVALLVAARASGRPAADRRGSDLLRGAAVVYMTVTGIVYALLLQGTDVDTAIAWVNSVVHQVMPVVVVADWLLDPPATRIGPRDWPRWLAYPVLWIAYTMIRGPIVGWYPYPFLDPANGGYGTVAVTIVAIFIGGVVLCVAVAAVGNGLRRRAAGRDTWQVSGA